MKQIQKKQKSIVKSIPAYGFKQSQEKPNQSKSLEAFVKCVWFPKKKARTVGKKSIPWGMDLKIYRKSTL
jgi:hypothetical protein